MVLVTKALLVVNNCSIKLWVAAKCWNVRTAPGVPNTGVQQIYGGQYCTVRESERFFPYRRDGQTGRMATMFWKT